MNFELFNIGCLLGLGALIGLMSAFLGLGGGLIMVPLLPVFLPMTAADAAATSLGTIFIVALCNGLSFTKQKLIHWQNAAWLGTSAGTVALMAAIGAAHASELALEIFFGVAVVLLLVFLLIERRQREPPALDRRRGRGTWIALGAFCGLFSGGTGLGAGLVAGPLLMRLRLTPAEQVVPMVNVMMIFTAGFGVTGFALSRPVWHGWHWGHIWLEVALLVFAGAQLTTPLGWRYQGQLSPVLRRRLLLGLLALILLKVWWGIIQDVRENL